MLILYPLDEIVITKAKNKSLRSDWEFDFVKDEQGETIDDKPLDLTKPTSDTTVNPKTGVKTFAFINCLVIIGTLSCFVVVRGKNKYKKI